MTHSRLLAATLIGALGIAGPGIAHAQSNPSADSIINSLRPGGGMMGGTRGIRPVSPAAAPAEASPAPVAAASRPTQAGRPAAPAVVVVPVTAQPPSVNLTVQFGNNSAELTPAAAKTLSELGRALASSSLAAYRFRIEGHTDTVGSADANKALSERRAQAVVAFLSGSFKIDAARLDAVGMGESAE